MSTITRESIADTIEGLEHLANSGIQSVYIDMAIAGMRRLLASLEAEPAGYHVIKECGAVGCSVATLKEAEETRDFWNKNWTIKPYFYAAPPAPVIPELKAVAWDYEWASCITCEGPQNFKRVIEREAPPEWAIEQGQARGIIPLYRLSEIE